MSDDRNKFPDIFVTEDMVSARVYLSDTFWVDVRPSMSIEEYEKYEAGLLTMKAREDSGLSRRGQGSSLDLNPGHVDLLHRNIVEWASDMPITKKTIGTLAQRHLKTIVNFIEKNNASVPFTQAPGQPLE